MNKMSEDEKKAIKIIREDIEVYKEKGAWKENSILVKSLRTLLNLTEKQQEELQKEKEKNKELFEEYNKRVGTIIKYEQAIKSFFDGTNITDIEPWTIYKIKGELLFELEELLEE